MILASSIGACNTHISGKMVIYNLHLWTLFERLC